MLGGFSGLLGVCVFATLAPVYEMETSALNAFLADLRSREPSLAARVGEVAARSLGTPYADGPLGEGPEGKYDKDPLMDVTRVDCVTFVEQTIALAASATYDDAFELLQRIRYRDGKTTFENRNHFLITDWIANNPFCRDVSAYLGVPTKTVARTISRRGLFERLNAPELGRGTPDRVVELAYVPVSDAGQAERKLPSPALLVFIGKVDWLFALHCGLYVRDDGGRGRLYHASSKAGRVVAVELVEYLRDTTRYLGFTAYAIGEPAVQVKPRKP